MKVEDKGKLNNPMKGGKIHNAIFIIVFYTVHWNILQIRNEEHNQVNYVINYYREFVEPPWLQWVC